MLDLLHKLLVTDPLVLALCVGILALSVPAINIGRTGRIIKQVTRVETALEAHLKDVPPTIEEHKRLVAEMANIKKMPEDIRKLMIAVSKIAAKLDIEVEL